MSRFLGRERNKSQSRQEKRLNKFILETKENMLRKYFEEKKDGNKSTENNKD